MPIPVKRVAPVKVDTNKIAIPEKIEVQIKPDTIRRAKVVKHTIIIGTVLSRDHVISQTIDTAGVIREQLIPIKPTDEVRIDEQGRVEVIPNKKKEWWQRTKKNIRNTALIVGAVVIIIYAVKP